MSEARERLIDFVRNEAVVPGDFTLASGLRVSYYVDLRSLTLDHRVAPLIGDVMLDLIAEVPDVAAVGGLTMGADPVATAMMHRAIARGGALDAFVVRKEPKDHGRGRQVEGPDVSGKRVIAVEDTSTSGGSVLKACAALERAGAEVAAVAVIVDRDTGAQQAVERAGYHYLAAIGLADLGV